MPTSRRRILLLTTVLAVAAVSVGAAAYAAGGDTPAVSAVDTGAGGPAGVPAGTPTAASPTSALPSVAPTASTASPDVPKTEAVSEYFYGLVTECMATASFDWQADISYSNGIFLSAETTTVDDVAPARQADYTLALYGDTTTVPYTWQDTGCWGYALHLTGNDGTV